MATKYPIIKHRAFIKTLTAAYHPFILDGFQWNFAWIFQYIMRNACDKKKEHRPKVKVKVTENTKTTMWAITSEPEVVETSGWFQNVPCQNIYQKCRSPHDAWRNLLCVTWRQINQIKRDFCIFSNFVNFVPIDIKIGTHIGPILYNIYKIAPIKIT